MNTKKLAMTAAIAALASLAGIIHWVSPTLIPFSFMPFMALLSGIILGAEYGALAMLVYMILGLLGLPVFATAPYGGIGYVFKPSFGYLLGYVAAAYVAGKIYRPGNFWWALIAALGGLFALYLFGLTYFYAVFRFVLDKPKDVAQVLAMGFLPFILWDLLKAAVAAWIGNEVVRRRMIS